MEVPLLVNLGSDLAHRRVFILQIQADSDSHMWAIHSPYEDQDTFAAKG